MNSLKLDLGGFIDSSSSVIIVICALIYTQLGHEWERNIAFVAYKNIYYTTEIVQWIYIIAIITIFYSTLWSRQKS